MSRRNLQRALLLCVAVALPGCDDQGLVGEVAAEESAVTTVDDLIFYWYRVKPSATTPYWTCSTGRIGCETQWGSYAPDTDHVLYMPQKILPNYRNKLLVFLNGANGEPDSPGGHQIYRVAAHQGYYVIGLSYFSAARNDNHPEEVPGAFSTCDSDTNCWGAALKEVVTGVDCGATCGPLNIDQHPQDAVETRLLRVLQWAVYNRPNEGWERFITRSGTILGDRINWNLITLAGFSNGSTYAAYMGLAHPEINRVALLNGPNDGNKIKRVWQPAAYLRNQPGLTDTRYYGLVHFRNHEDKLYQLTAAYDAMGVKGKVMFDPKPNPTEATDFNGAHMLISIEPQTPPEDGHTSVFLDELKDCDVDPADPYSCTIGYEEGWRYIFASGRTLIVSGPMGPAAQ